MEQKLLSRNVGFELVVEDEETIAVRAVYPANASADEILNIVNNTRQVTLHCFDPLLIDELYLLGKEISCRNHKLYEAAMKRKGLWDVLKSLVGRR